MCKLIVALKRNNSQFELFKKTIIAQREALIVEPHGIAAMIIDQNKKISVKKELQDYDKVLNWVYSNLKNALAVIIHTRQATSGNINEANIHLFKVGNYYFAHNGIIHEYGGICAGESQMSLNKTFDPTGKTFKVFDDEDSIYEDADVINNALEQEEKNKEKNSMCDSYRFLTNLQKPITRISLIGDIERLDFNGVGVLVNDKTKNLIVFSTRNFVVHTNFKDYSIAYSYDPKNTLFHYQNALGFPITIKDKSEKVKSYSVNSGVYELKVGRNKNNQK